MKPNQLDLLDIILSLRSLYLNYSNSFMIDSSMATQIPGKLVEYKTFCRVQSGEQRKIASLRHKGDFKVREKWFKYNSKTKFNAEEFSYQWDGYIKIALGGLITVHAIDKHSSGFGYGE